MCCRPRRKTGFLLLIVIQLRDDDRDRFERLRGADEAKDGSFWLTIGVWGQNQSGFFAGGWL
jgi:hypothetical protein